MSISFYGKRTDGEAIFLDIEDDAYLNMASANGRAFLEFLGIEPGEEPAGEVTVPEARRAVMRARATFDRNVGNFIRDPSDTKRPGQVRVITGGLDPAFFTRRINDFEKFLNAIVEKGAVSIYWA